MQNRSIELAAGHVLNRYNVDNVSPRPESFIEDVLLGQNLEGVFRESLYKEIATAAETGWDFSTRWMKTAPELASLHTSSVIPVDLNCILHSNELTLSRFFSILGNKDKQDYYAGQAAKRLAAIQIFFWDNENLRWADYLLNGSRSEANFYPSNLYPFWANAYDTTVITPDVIALILKKFDAAFAFPAGVPTSFIRSGQQWDFPNGWPPTQFFIIEGFNNIAEYAARDLPLLAEKSSALAYELASKWIISNYCGWEKTGLMYEKYDVTKPGTPGGGGEYVVQDGFGWTNGVALGLLRRYGHVLDLTDVVC